MKDCNYISRCGFYQDKLAKMPSTAEFMKMEFCHKKPILCARQTYYESKNIDNVPDDLMPNEMHRIMYLR